MSATGEIGLSPAAARLLARPQAPAVAAAVLAVAAVAEVLLRPGPEPNTFRLIALAMISLAGTLPAAFLGVRAAATIVCGADLISLGDFGLVTGAGLIATLIAVYRVGRRGPDVWAPVLTVPFVVLALVGDSTARVPAVLMAALAPAAALIGITVRARCEALVHRAARQAVASALVEHTARGERVRIARELHDVVAHHISMISVQAETARLTTAGLPPAGAQRLVEIGSTARAGLTEMRRLLGVLREGDPIAERHPQPGLAQLNALLDDARDSSRGGARLIVSGPPVELEPGVELAAYRIVQEALTNARRHAPGAAVDVELHYRDHDVVLRIRDNGPGTPADRSNGETADGADGAGTQRGHGLLGMRERAAAAGGELRIGARAGAGFVVEARLPRKLETGG